MSANRESEVNSSVVPGDCAETYLQAILDSAVDGIITIDERGKIESANKATERLFGYERSEMVGQNVKLLMPSPYREEHDGYLSRYLKTGQRKIIGIGREVQGRRKDGTTFPMYLSVSEIMVDSRRLFTGIVHDTTDLKKAEATATRVGRILEDALNEIYIFNAETLRFEVVNRGARHNLGYSMEELRQLTPVDIKPEYDQDKFEQMVAPLRSGESSAETFETLHVRKDGTTYPVEVHLQMSRFDEEEVFVAIILDISERKRAQQERALLNQELEGRIEQLRIRNQALQSAGEGVVIANLEPPNHPIVFVNRAFEILTGYSADEVLGESCCLLHREDIEQPGVQAITKALCEASEAHVVVRNYRKDGQMFWNEITIAPVQADDGHTTHVVAVMEDVTDRRRTQERLVQSERLAAIGEMVTGLAHESRNALQRAQACTDMLSLDLDQPEQIDLINRTRTAIDDLRRLYEEVRSYAAPITLHRRLHKLSDIWNKVWNDLAMARAGLDIQLVQQARAAEATCPVDDHRLEQVFRNIFENAIAVMPTSGRIQIDCRDTTLDSKPALLISVRDDGPGMTAEVAASIFQPFFTTKQKGTGLGMAIVKRIIDTHGGRIEAHNCEGPGIEITIELPKTLPVLSAD